MITKKSQLFKKSNLFKFLSVKRQFCCIWSPFAPLPKFLQLVELAENSTNLVCKTLAVVKIE